MTTPATEARRARSLPVRIAGVFLSPGELFEELRDHPAWVGPLLVSMAVAIAVVLALPSEVFVEQLREEMRRAGAPAAEISRAEALAGMAPLLGVISVVVGQPLRALVLAGLLTLLFSRLAGGPAGFRQYLAVATHTMLIPALGAALTFPVQVIAREAELRLSAALLLPSRDPGSVWTRVLEALDVFTLWAIVVLGLGVHVLDRRTSWATASLLLFGLYLLVVAGAALAAR